MYNVAWAVLILSLRSNEVVHIGLSAEVSSKDFPLPSATLGEELGGGGGNIRKPAAGCSQQVFYPSAPSLLPAHRTELGVGVGGAVRRDNPAPEEET